MSRTKNPFRLKYGLVGYDIVDSHPKVLDSYFDTLKDYFRQEQLPARQAKLSKKLRDRWFSRVLDISEEELAREKREWESGKLKLSTRNLRPPRYDFSRDDFMEHNLHVGDLVSVELECVFADCDDVPNERLLGDDLLVECEEDGSLCYTGNRNDSDEENYEEDYDDNSGSAEYKVTFRRKRPMRLKAVLDQLLKCNAEVNITCGTHIHLDQRGVPQQVASERARRLIMLLPALKEIVAPSRRDNEEYCRENRPIKLGVKHRHQTDRYLAINFTDAYLNHSTIENRLHGGTLDFWKILNWIDLNTWAMDAGEIDEVALRNARSKGSDKLAKVYLPDLLRMETLPDTTRAYVWGRYATFNKQGAKALRQQILKETPEFADMFHEEAPENGELQCVE